MLCLMWASVVPDKIQDMALSIWHILQRPVPLRPGIPDPDINLETFVTHIWLSELTVL